MQWRRGLNPTKPASQLNRAAKAGCEQQRTNRNAAMGATLLHILIGVAERTDRDRIAKDAALVLIGQESATPFA